MTVIAVGREALDAQTGLSGSAAQRMQQRLEWEKELLAAAPRQGEERQIREPADPHEDPRQPDPNASKQVAPHPVGSESAQSQGGGRSSEIGGNYPSPESASNPRAETAVRRSDAPSHVLAGRGRSASEPSTRPLVRNAGAPQRSQPAWADPEPKSFGFFNDEGAIRMWMRDARIARSAGPQLVQRMRALLARIDLRLSAFTLNGKKLVNEGRVGTGNEEPSVTDPERELDLFF